MFLAAHWGSPSLLKRFRRLFHQSTTNPRDNVKQWYSLFEYLDAHQRTLLAARAKNYSRGNASMQRLSVGRLSCVAHLSFYHLLLPHLLMHAV